MREQLTMKSVDIKQLKLINNRPLKGPYFAGKHPAKMIGDDGGDDDDDDIVEGDDDDDDDEDDEDWDVDQMIEAFHWICHPCQRYSSSWYVGRGMIKYFTETALLASG